MSIYGDLAHLGTEDFPFDTDEVSDVHELLHHAIVELLVLGRAELISGDVDLDTASRVLELEEGSLTHDTTAHDTASDTYLTTRCIILEGIEDLTGIPRDDIFVCWIRIDTEGTKLLKTTATEDLLFAQL